MAALALDNITRTFAPNQPGAKAYTAVRDTTLIVAPGEFVSVVGPTGCGKSTLLNVAAGLLVPSSGAVKVFDAPLAGINRQAGYMFQADALMPWRSVLDNVAAGLTFRGVSKEEARKQAEGAFDINTVFAGILVLTAFALILDSIVTFAEKRLLVWQPRAGQTEGK